MYFLHDASVWFQHNFLTWLELFYLRTLRSALRGKNPYRWFFGACAMLILMFIFFGIRQPNVVLFPVNEPTFVNVFAELPVGSDITATNQFMYKLEKRIDEIILPYRPIVESVLTTIGKGVVGENEFTTGNTPNKGMCTITFLDYQYRKGINTQDVMKKLSDNLLGKYPGVKIQVVKNQMGPPTGKPINLEISGPDFTRLLQITQSVQEYLEKANVKGVEGFKINLDVGMPELLVNIDRDKVRRFGMSTAQVASNIRTALFGKEISKYKEGEDDYPIMLRLDKKYRHDIATLLNQKITFRNQSNGKIVQIPISAVATFTNGTTFDSVNRKDLDKVITLWSNVIEGYNPASINQQLMKIMKDYKLPEKYSYRFTGEQKEQEETMAFLIKAMMIACALIMLILVTQFNSFVKPLIIMMTVIFSTIGVFGGIATFKMDFVIIMTGIGLVSLAGVVVNNAIVLIDYIDFLKANAKKKLGLNQSDELDINDSVECIVQAGRTRLRPVLLTAITTVLGLVPMALGMNINFSTFLSRLDPQIYFGGDNALFWGPMAWTVIFGLTFATILTLVMVPVMYYIGNRTKLAFLKKFKRKQR